MRSWITRYLVAGLALILCALSMPDPALAQTSCPTPTAVAGEIPRLSGQITPGVICQSANTTGGLAGLEYDNATTVNIDFNPFAPPGTTTVIFRIWAPDDAPRPAGTNPVKIVFAPTGATSRAAITTATCPGATINGVGTTLVEVALANFSTCTLFVSAPAGPGGALISYTATLVRVNDVYTLSPGTLTGGLFGGTVATSNVAADVRQETQERIATFLHRRSDMLLEAEPDRGRIHSRLAGPNGGQGTGTSFAGGPAIPYNLAVSGDGVAPNLSFSTSLSQVARSNAAADQRRRSKAQGHAMSLGQMATPTQSAPALDGIDVWVDGTYTGFHDDTGGGDRNGHLGVFYVGADRLINPALLIGVLAQFDSAQDDSTRLGSNVEGKGWMAGPYVSAKLRENLFFDARGAWGTSDNEINLIGLTKDSFDTTRLLATARLTGNYQLGGLRISPSVAVKYIKEEQKSFTNSLGIFIPGQSVTLGRLSFGPEFSYRHQAANGTIIEPHASITGLWDFDDAGPLTLGNTVAGGNDLRAKVDGGVRLTLPSGISLGAKVSYDGIGDNDFSAYSGKLQVNIPLTRDRASPGNLHRREDAPSRPGLQVRELVQRQLLVRLSAAEYDAVRMRAGPMSVSAYLRWWLEDKGFFD